MIVKYPPQYTGLWKILFNNTHAIGWINLYLNRNGGIINNRELFQYRFKLQDKLKEEK